MPLKELKQTIDSFISVRDFSQTLGISKASAQRLLDRNHIPSIVFGVQKKLYRKADIIDLIDKLRSKQTIVICGDTTQPGQINK